MVSIWPAACLLGFGLETREVRRSQTILPRSSSMPFPRSLDTRHESRGFGQCAVASVDSDSLIVDSPGSAPMRKFVAAKGVNGRVAPGLMVSFSPHHPYYTQHYYPWTPGRAPGL